MYPRPGLGLLLVGIAAGCLSGCQSGGPREVVFSRPEPSSFVLGKTSYRQILEQYGQPTRRAPWTKNGISLETLSYGHGPAGQYQRPHVPDDANPERWLSFAFLDGRLVEYLFYSSFEDDHTDFDETKIPEIQKGQTTFPQVISLLGKPAGFSIFPFVRAKDEHGITYNYVHTRKGRFYHKRLTVSFNARNVATDYDFLSEGDR